MDEMEKLFKEIEKEEENKAWAAKKAEYGDKFNAKKFYELEAFWPNFWAWISITWWLPIAIWLVWLKHSHS